MRKSMILLACLLMALSLQARDDRLIGDHTAPAMISLCTPIQFPSSDWSVSGLRIGIFYSNCDIMTGLDLGFINRSRETRAFQFGFANITETMGGVQLGIINYADQAVGIQIGLFNIIADNTLPCLPLFNASF